MTSLILLISKLFVWAFGFFDFFGNLINWILFFGACIMFCYWCWELIVPLGNNKDNDYKSPSASPRPYYDKALYSDKK